MPRPRRVSEPVVELEKEKEKKKVEIKKATRTEPRAPSKSQKERFTEWYHESIMGKDELAFTVEEIKKIAYYCLVYQQSHARSREKDESDGGEAAYYHGASKIRDKIKAFLKAKEKDEKQ